MAQQPQHGKSLKPQVARAVSLVASDYEGLRGSSSPAPAVTFQIEMGSPDGIAVEVPKSIGF